MVEQSLKAVRINQYFRTDKIMYIAIVGYGGMGRYHFTRLEKTGIVKTKGVFDTDSKRTALAASDGLHVYEDYRQIAADKDIGGVLIATPNDVHAKYIEYFTRYGKRVLCEKPVVNSAAEFERLLENTGDGVFTVNQNRRFDADYLTAKEVIESGAIGKVYRIESRVTGANGIPGGWRKLKKHGGGMMLDWGVHLIDQALCMFPRIKALRCVYSYALGFGVEDGFIAELFTDCGTHFIIEVQTNDFIGVDRWKVFGRDGSAVIKNWSVEGDITLPVYGSDVEVVSIPAGNGLTKTMSYRSHDSVEVKPLPKVSPDVDRLYRDFAGDGLNGDMTVKHDEVLRVLKVMDKCKQSAKRGGSLIAVNI